MEKSNQTRIRHPKADELNKLEKQKQIAKQNNDREAYSAAKQSIIKLIRENRMQVTQEQWDSFSYEQKESYIQIKMREAKILNDKEEFNSWLETLNNLNERRLSNSNSKTDSKTNQKKSLDAIEVDQPSYSSDSNSNELEGIYQELFQELEGKKDYNFYFDEIVKVAQQYSSSEHMTEEQKKQFIGEVFYFLGYLTDSLTNEDEILQVLTRAVNELCNNEIQLKVQDILLKGLQERRERMHPKGQQVKSEATKQNENVANKNGKDGLGLSGLIEQLRYESNKVQTALRSMLSGRYVDDQKLVNFGSRINTLIDDGYVLKDLATNSSDIEVISEIINRLEEDQNKINKITEGIERVGRIMK